MHNGFRLKFRRGDLLAFALVALLAIGAALLFLPRESDRQGSTVQIYKDGVLVEEFSLQAERTVEIEGKYSNLVTVQNGRAAITRSTCPGSDCVHSGWISGPGRSVVCLPNRVEVRIAGIADVDFVVR